MKPAPYIAVGDGIFCVETGLYRHGLAACYLVRSDDRLAVIDTGTSRTLPGLLGVIADLGLTPAHVDLVIPTHVHLDHAGGAGALMAACPRARLLVHPKGAPHLIDPAKLTAGATEVYGAEDFAHHFGALTPIPEDRVQIADDGTEVDLAGRRLTFVHTPGHANHHGCIFDAHERAWFTGDTFGIAYRELATEAGPWLFAPTTPVAFDPDAWRQSLTRLLGPRPRAMFLTHYGRVDHPERLVDGLRRSIADLAGIALGEAESADPGREDRLRRAVGDHLKAAARAHGVGLADAELTRLLDVDTELNAQGLEVWLRRRAKHAAGRSDAPAGGGLRD